MSRAMGTPDPESGPETRSGETTSVRFLKTPNPDLSRELLAYLGSLTCTQGEGAGEPFRVLPWQAQFLEGAFAPDVQVAAFSSGRAQGKTTLASGIAAAALDGPLAKPRGQVIVCASSLNQSRILHASLSAFLVAKHGKLRRPDWSSTDGPNLVRIVRLDSGAEVRAIAADPARAHGLAPSLLLLDEPAQWPPAHADRLWAALMTSLGKHPGSRAIVMGTRPATGAGNFFGPLLDGGADFAQVHAADREADPLDPEAWAAANPSLPAFPALRATIAREAKRAATSPELLASFRALRLNAGVSDTRVHELISALSWRRCVQPAEMLPPLAWGVDLGHSAAMTAVACFSLTTGALDALAAYPSLPSLAERGRLDGVADLYQKMHDRGELLVHDGHTVKVAAILRQAAERWGAPVLLASDYYKRSELRDGLAEAGIRPAVWETRRGGPGDGGEDVGRFRRAVLELTVKAAPSLLLASAIGEARTVANAAGVEKLATGHAGGRRSRARDDAAAAAVLAVAVAERRRSGMSKPRPRRWAVTG